MRKFVIALPFIAVLGACSAQSVEPRHLRADSLVRKDAVGDACTTSDGRSGYLVTAGYADQLVCQAN